MRRADIVAALQHVRPDPASGVQRRSPADPDVVISELWFPRTAQWSGSSIPKAGGTGMLPRPVRRTCAEIGGSLTQPTVRGLGARREATESLEDHKTQLDADMARRRTIARECNVSAVRGFAGIDLT